MLSCTVKYTQNNCYVVDRISLAHVSCWLRSGVQDVLGNIKSIQMAILSGGRLFVLVEPGPREKWTSVASVPTSLTGCSETWLSLAIAFLRLPAQCFPSVLNLKGFCKSFSYFVCCVTFALVFLCLASSIFLCSSETVHYTYQWCDYTAPHWPFCNMRLCQKASAASQAATLYHSFYR